MESQGGDQVSDQVEEQVQERAGGGRRARLTRDRIVAAAMELADAEGIDAVTMRGVARRLGAEAMSLYRHVRDKDEILDALVDEVYAEIALPRPGTPWIDAMRDRANATREVLLRHQWSVGLMESRRHPGPANLRHHDAVVAFLVGAGFDARTTTHVYNLLDSYIYGFVLQELSLPFGSSEEMEAIGAELLGGADPDAYPHLAQASAELLAGGFDYADEFAVGLELVLDAITRLEQRNGAAGSGRSA
jgi:AcrR family transcriptional regulator